MIFVHPEKRVGDQEILHFGAAVIENQRAPIGLRALTRIGVLVKMRAIEFGQAVSVARKMRRRPIEEHADAGLMQAIDESHEVVGRAVAAGGREVADGLIAPGAVEGMLHHGHEFDVRKAHFLQVGDQLIRGLAVGEPAISLLGVAAPGAEMQFVNRDRRGEPVVFGALGDPCGIVPFVLVEARHDRARARAKFGAEAVRIGLEEWQAALARADFIFVDRAFAQTGDEEFPEAR